jgi:hypothetical protein
VGPVACGGAARGALLRIAWLRRRAGSPAPKIGPVLALIALLLVGAAVIAVAVVVLLRTAWATEPKKVRYPDREQGEREVYEKLYGKRSLTVSAPVPVEPRPDADADSPRTHAPPADPSPRRRPTGINSDRR